MNACATRINTSKIIEVLGRQPRPKARKTQQLVNKAFEPKKDGKDR